MKKTVIILSCVFLLAGISCTKVNEDFTPDSKNILKGPARDLHPCPGVEVLTKAQNTEGYEDLSITYMYDVRDSILVKSEKGENIIRQYYLIGDYLVQNSLDALISSDFVNYYRLFKYANNCSKILVESGNESLIIVDDEIYDFGVVFLNKLKSEINEPEVKSTLLEISDMLESYHNKSKTYILSDLEIK